MTFLHNQRTEEDLQRVLEIFALSCKTIKLQAIHIKIKTNRSYKTAKLQCHVVYSTTVNPF